MAKEVFLLMKLKDIKRMLTLKNNLTIYYKINNEITPVFDIKRKLIEYGFKRIIIGYFSYKDMYVHPVDHSSMSSWRFVNPFVLDLESSTVTYEVLRNNEILPYSNAKIKDDKLLVKAPIHIPSTHSYGYVIDLY